jgi:hypothetical protein
MSDTEQMSPSGVKLVQKDEPILHKRFLTCRKGLILWAVIFMAVTVSLCSAQSVTSARSGTLYYFEGDVSIDGAPVQWKAGRFNEIKDQSVLRTAIGRAEVLLTPGVFLRVGERSAVKMIDNRLVSTRLEVLSGNIIVESEDPLMSVKDSPVALIYKECAIQLVKHGLIEIGVDPPHLKIYQGEALVSTPKGRTTVRKGRQLSLPEAAFTEKFDDKAGDNPYLWARGRSLSISAANMLSVSILNPGAGGASSAGSEYSTFSANSNGSGLFDASILSGSTGVPAKRIQAGSGSNRRH